MKEALQNSTTVMVNKTRNGSSQLIPPKVHQRGDKVVVNGAKQSLLAILRKQVCKCSKHTLEKMTLKFLTLNRITASYDILVWMFIFLKQNCENDLFINIVKEYIMKMQKKKQEDECHQSQKYIMSKKKTLEKFIRSAEILQAEVMDQKTIDQSVGALYSKGKSKDNALKKIIVYLKKINFEDCVSFLQSGCSFYVRNEPQQIEDEISTPQNSKNEASDNSEDTIYDLVPLDEKPTEETPIEMPRDYQNMSSRQNATTQSFDLFDELIQPQESAYSLFSDYLIFE